MTDPANRLDLRAMADRVATDLIPGHAVAAQIRAATNAAQVRDAADHLESLADAAGLHGTVPQYTLQDELMAAADRLRAVADAQDAITLRGTPRRFAASLGSPVDHGNKLTVISHPPAGLHGCGGPLPCSCNAGAADAWNPAEWGGEDSA